MILYAVLFALTLQQEPLPLPEPEAECTTDTECEARYCPPPADTEDCDEEDSE